MRRDFCNVQAADLAGSLDNRSPNRIGVTLTRLKLGKSFTDQHQVPRSAQRMTPKKILSSLDHTGEVVPQCPRGWAEKPLKRILGIWSGQVAGPLELDVASKDGNQGVPVVVDHRGLRKKVYCVGDLLPECVERFYADGGKDLDVRVLGSKQVDG